MSAAMAARRWHRAVRVSAGGLVWSAGLVLAAVWVPAYDSSETSSAVNGVTLTHATLLQVNGARVLVPVGLPALMSVVVLCAIRARRAGARWGTAVAGAAVTALAAETMLGILSIGVFVAPVAILQGAAVRLAPGAPAGEDPRPQGAAGGGGGASSEPATGT
jgi:hypothetical protein